MAQISDSLLTISEASGKLGVSKLTLRNWDNKGILKAIRVGERGDRRYRASDIDGFLTEKTETKEIDRALLDSFLKTQTFWAEEAPAVPITLEEGVDKMTNAASYFEKSLSHCIFLYENDLLHQYLSIEESITACKSHLHALHQSPETVKRFLADCDTQFETFDAIITRGNFLELDKLSNDQLNNEFLDFQAALGRFWRVTIIVEAYAPFLDQYYLPKFEKDVGDRKAAREAFVTLSLPTDLSFVSQERRDLLRLIIRFLKSAPERRRLLTSSDADYLAHLSTDNQEFLFALERHVANYFWVQNSYGTWQKLSLHDYLGFIRDIIKEQSPADLEKELKQLTSQASQKREQELLEKKLGLSKETREELAFIRRVVWIKDERKKHVLKMLHVIHCFLEEYAKRTGIPSRTLGFAHIAEMPKVLRNELGEKELEDRMAGMLHISQSGERKSFIIGNDMLLIREVLVRPHEGYNDALQGTIACKGTSPVVQGTVRIILDPRDKEIGPDDILVTSMTRPDFVPLMRKAKAIVTDEDGITCHAAIVSREMNKPCIIGTRSATKVLKNGDRIEMRMNHGVVKPAPYA